MKANTYYLFENGKKLHFSYSLEKLINYTVNTHNAEIYMEFENYSECVTVEVNPFTETITVID